MTRIKTPECSNPFEVTVNGRKYSYEAGIETDVPDEVAAIIEKHNKAHKKEAPNTVAPFSGGATSWNDLKDKPFYEEVKEAVVENTTNTESILEGFPVFSIGDSVTVKVDGIEYLLIAYDDDSYANIGDTYLELQDDTGSLGWQIFVDTDSSVYFYSHDSHTVSYNAITVKPLDSKYLPYDAVIKPTTLENWFEIYNPKSDLMGCFELVEGNFTELRTKIRNDGNINVALVFYNSYDNEHYVYKAISYILTHNALLCEFIMDRLYVVLVIDKDGTIGLNSRSIISLEEFIS